jgi:sialidase-1
MILAHSNASDPYHRNNLTIKISYDEGKTWERSILVDRTKDVNKLPWTAYSDLVKINPITLGILYERANYSEIVFKKIEWEKD